MNAARFNPREAIHHLRMIATDRAQPHTTLRFAYKLVTPDNRGPVHLDYYPRTDRTTGEQYFWLEKDYLIRYNSSRRFDPTRILTDVADRIGQAHEIDAKLKVMVAPALFSSRPGASRRLQYVAKPCLHLVALDYDANKSGAMADDLKRQLLKLRPLLIRSGSPHSFHAYVGVDALSMSDHDRLSRTLRAHFHCDAKARPNDLLGLAGTQNIKPGATGVRIVRTRDNRLIDPHHFSSIQEVVDQINIPLQPALSYDLTTPWAPASIDSVPSATLKCLRRRVREYFDRNGTDDLSRANYHIVSLCAELKLNPAQALAFMTRYLPLGSFKFANSPHDLAHDIQAIYTKRSAKVAV